MLARVLLLAALPASALAQTGSLQGRVRDEQGVAVEGAAVVARTSAEGDILASTATDPLGFFRLDGLRVGPAVLDVRRLGFADRTADVEVREGQTETVAIELAVEALEVEGITVGARRSSPEVAFDEEAGLAMRAIEARQLRTLPGFIEPDPLRAAEALPGVVATSDFSAAFTSVGDPPTRT